MGKKKIIIKIPKVKPRNHFALDAKSRKAGKMKHKNEPRGGAKKKDYTEEE